MTEQNLPSLDVEDDEINTENFIFDPKLNLYTKTRTINSDSEIPIDPRRKQNPSIGAILQDNSSKTAPLPHHTGLCND